MAKKTIDIELNYKTNASSYQKALSQLDKILSNFSKANNIHSEWGDTKDVAQKIKTMFQDAWNPKIGQLDLTKINKSFNEVFRRNIKC